MLISSSKLVFTFLLGAVAFVSASSEDLDPSLEQRQQPQPQPGTPLWDCHDTCGNAITLSRGSDLCADKEFETDYNDCLACAGPDNEDIWSLYGDTLSKAGAKCGLSTEPLSGSETATASAATGDNTEPTSGSTAEAISGSISRTASASEATSTAGSTATDTESDASSSSDEAAPADSAGKLLAASNSFFIGASLMLGSCLVTVFSSSEFGL